MRVAGTEPEIHISGVMPFLRPALFLAAIVVAGCGGAAVSPARPPAPVGEESTRTKNRLPPPKLIAPPPAYGNKIVMAGVARAGG